MTIDDKIIDGKKYNLMLTEKQRKYHHYNQVKLITMKSYRRRNIAI